MVQIIILFNWVTLRWTSRQFSGFFSSTLQAKSPKSSIDLPGWSPPCSPRMLHNNQPSCVLIEDLQLETPPRFCVRLYWRDFWILWSFTTSKRSTFTGLFHETHHTQAVVPNAICEGFRAEKGGLFLSPPTKNKTNVGAFLPINRRHQRSFQPIFFWRHLFTTHPVYRILMYRHARNLTFLNPLLKGCQIDWVWGAAKQPYSNTIL